MDNALNPLFKNSIQQKQLIHSSRLKNAEKEFSQEICVTLKAEITRSQTFNVNVDVVCSSPFTLKPCNNGISYNLFELVT